ncbi:hypothetical protein LAWI1_G001654 [Lachnellula willkommii]|uniref:CFEM domain-containing protein n=1 Tax=Lachnellula willkommii TaxID=215461 RepID=A0A559MD01_9HELO|nr:hypothetical protein LAWI1_G001654 [Lachnellula willkommii]
MKTTLLVLAATGLASAQVFNGEPQCALPCLQSAIASAGCGPDDYICQCISAREKIQDLVTPCLISACNGSEVAVAASVGLGLCSGFSASLAAGTGTAASTPASTPASTTAPTLTTIDPSPTDILSRFSVYTSNGTTEIFILPTTNSTAIETGNTTLSTTAKPSGSSGITTTKLISSTATGESGTRTKSSSAAATSKSAGGAPTVLAGARGIVGVVAAMLAAL